MCFFFGFGLAHARMTHLASSSEKIDGMNLRLHIHTSIFSIVSVSVTIFAARANKKTRQRKRRQSVIVFSYSSFIRQKGAKSVYL